MKVVLKKDVPNLGRAGDVEDVADGYARNFLIPQGLASPATPGAVKQAEMERAAQQRREKREQQEAEQKAARLTEQTFTVTARAGEGERLYGSITSANLAEAIQEVTGLDVDRRSILLEQPIRELGEHVVPVKLHKDVVAEVKVIVAREE